MSRRGAGCQWRWSPCAHPSRGGSTNAARDWTPAGSFLRGAPSAFGLMIPDNRQRSRPFHDDFLAVRREPVRRDQVAGTLWPDVGEERAFASLRSDLWRLQGPAKIVIEVSSRELRL